jgi:hypothetical protein
MQKNEYYFEYTVLQVQHGMVHRWQNFEKSPSNDRGSVYNENLVSRGEMNK